MQLTNKLKAQMDAMPYESMLSKWRFAPIGDPMFQGESGDYFAKRMKELRDAGADHVGMIDHVEASKAIGWEP